MLHLCAQCVRNCTMSQTKTERLHARLTAEQASLLRRAAEIKGISVTDFALNATLSQARDVLTDQRLFLLDDAAWEEFNRILDRPVEHKPRLEKLFAEGSIFE